MDEAFLLMLSNLLHLQNHLDPSTSPLTTTTPTTTLLTTSTTTPLLFFTLTSILSLLTTTTHPSSSPSPSLPTSLSTFRTLTTTLSPTALNSHFRTTYGLSYGVFTTLLNKLTPHILSSHLSLPPDYSLSLVLTHLHLNTPLPTLSHLHNLPPFLLSKLTHMITRLLSTHLYSHFIKFPPSSPSPSTSPLPNLIGAIDSSPIRLNHLPSPSYSSPHGFPSIQLQVVAGHPNKLFFDVCVKAPGSIDDATHFRDSLLYHNLINGHPPFSNHHIVNVRGHPVRPYLVGDWCFPLLSFLLTPFSGNGRGTPAQNTFDSALMKGRMMVVEAIGLLKGRWKILQNLNVGLHHAPQTIVACCVLHNLCQIAKEPEPPLWKDPEENGPPPRVLESERSFYYYGENLRQTLADDLHQRLSSSSR